MLSADDPSLTAKLMQIVEQLEELILVLPNEQGRGVRAAIHVLLQNIELHDHGLPVS